MGQTKRKHRTHTSAVALAALGLALAACGSDESASESATTEPAAAESSAEDDGGGDELPNACPVDGCSISIASAEAADGEVAVVFDANFTPDFERNHIHIYWDAYEAGSVSSDFQERGFEDQGKWHPTDEYPNYTTESDASVSSEFRGDSTTLCVTAADTDHSVIDPTIEECLDVSEFIG